MAEDWGQYRPCTADDTKAFLAVPGIVDYVTRGLQFTGPVEILPEAVRASKDNPKRLQYLVMGGQPTIDADEDNREGYAFVTDGAIAAPFKPIVLPVLT
ncbi:hypothetical protein ACIA8O_37215 [Kitasatospora sp. NPDC051853]|uniref:hypothetical protein n=1 Tax=Kitasatospora sp. NPDC051853 TaxID=3364058 RepID=UPI0037877B8B